MEKMNKLISLSMIVLFLLSFSFCSVDEVIKEKEDKINIDLLSKSNTEKQTVKFNIINKSENVILIIDNYEADYNDTIKLNNINFNENNDTLILDGELKTNLYQIHKGLIFIPLKEYYSNNIILFDNCPWFIQNGYKILKSIQFDVTVESW